MFVLLLDVHLVQLPLQHDYTDHYSGILLGVLNIQVNRQKYSYLQQFF